MRLSSLLLVLLPVTACINLLTPVQAEPIGSNSLEQVNLVVDSSLVSQHTFIAAKGSQLIKVQEFEIEGATVFTEEELAEVVEPWQNRSLTIDQLYGVRSAISELYKESGFVNSGAYIPEQKFSNGIVKIAVLEGGLEEIRISGNRSLKDNYIKSRLDANPELVNTNDLLKSLQLLRLDPKIKSISAELSAGVNPGKSLLDIKIKEQDSFYATASLDNGRTPSVGSFQRSIGLNHNSLLGFGDRASFSYTNSEGSDGINLNYSLPVNAKNGTISAGYGFSDNEIIEEAFTPLDIESRSQQYQLGFRQPLMLTPNREFALGLNLTHQQSETSLLGDDFPLSRGADENGETKVTALRFSQDFTNRNDKRTLAFRSQFSLGLDALGATINDEGPDGTFFAWKGQSQWVRRLDEDFLFLLRGDVQLSGGSLVPIEQFRAGGINSARGYRQDLSLGDSGAFASAEMRIPVLRFDKVGGVVQLTPFLDFATLWNSDDVEIANSTLPSLGLGLNFNMADRLNARLDWGIPLTNVDGGDSLQESGVYFSINSNLF